MEYLRAFAVGGLICAVGQLLIDRTGLTPARILVLFVTSGVVLSALGVYGPLIDYAGAGASVPIAGFGHILAEGVRRAVERDGPIGILTGGMTAAAGGLSAAILFGWAAALLFRPRDKT